MKHFIVTAAALLMLALPARAQAPASSAVPPTQEFVSKTAISSMFEIEAAKLAEQKISNPAYQDFAKMIISDHTKAGDQLKSMVRNMPGLQVPSNLDREHEMKLQMLRSETGASFERQYRIGQIQGHEEAVELFQKYAQNGSQSELKTWAKDTVPVLETHLQHAQALPDHQHR